MNSYIIEQLRINTHCYNSASLPGLTANAFRAEVDDADLSIKILQITKGTRGVTAPCLFTLPVFKKECNTIPVIFIIHVNITALG